MPSRPLLEVCLSPALLPLYDIRDTIVVIIDVFRATSTITAALHNGAKAVIPIASVEECIAIKSRYPDYITAGERDGKVASGLEYGNSPLEYPASFIKGKTLALTTTNGTKLLHMVKDATEIVIGSFLNLDAVGNYLIKKEKKILLGCSAWKDRINMEDTLLAGALVDKLQSKFDISSDDGPVISMRLWQEATKEKAIIDFLKNTSHYRRLSGFGVEEDMKYCTTPNLHPIVPTYNGVKLVIAS